MSALVRSSGCLDVWMSQNVKNNRRLAASHVVSASYRFRYSLINSFLYRIAYVMRLVDVWVHFKRKFDRVCRFFFFLFYCPNSMIFIGELGQESCSSSSVVLPPSDVELELVSVFS